MNFPVDTITLFKSLISRSKKVLVTTHYNPDGDAVGASLALYHFLVKFGHQVDLIIPNDLPSFLKWVPGSAKLLIYNNNPETCNEIIHNAEVIFCLDFNALSRVRYYSDELSKATGFKVLIDHHLQPSDEFDLSLSEIKVSSTSELVYQLVAELSYEHLIDKPIAECLVVGIMTDTGSFSYSCDTPETFRIMASLIEKGAGIERIHRLVYDTYSESRMRLLGHCLSRRLKVIHELNTAYIWLSKDDLTEFNYQPGDTEGVVNYALSIENVSLAALFTERDDRIRISLRSKGNFSVNEFARLHFNGGGHRNAAGADSFVSLKETLDLFENIIAGYREQLNNNSF